MYQANAMQYLATSAGASITALTGAGYWGGIFAYCSGAAGSLTVKDSAAIILIWSGAAAATISYNPVFAVAVTGGLSVTGSGGVAYIVNYRSQ